MIGVKLVSVEDFRHEMSKGGATFLRQTFTDPELGDRDVVVLAGLAAAKAAVVAASPSPIASVLDVVVSRDALGRPRARAAGRDFEVSISHDGDYVVAVAVVTSGAT